MPGAFVDTNLLVYAADERNPEAPKTLVARELLRQPGLHLSVQVLNEFIANARHASKLNLSRDRERRWIGAWLLFPVVPLSTDTFLRALAIHLRHQVSHWDALILAAAIEAGCERVYSEDLGNGRRYEGVIVVNPFV